MQLNLSLTDKRDSKFEYQTKFNLIQKLQTLAFRYRPTNYLDKNQYFELTRGMFHVLLLSTNTTYSRNRG